MNNLKEYIIEKFKINSKNVNKSDYLTNEEKDKITDELCRYFQSSGSYNTFEYETRLEIVEEYFDNDIYAFLDKLDLWDDLSDYIKIDPNELANYVENNKEELYKEINEFVLR